MNFLFKSEVVNYTFSFHNKEDTILFLHGWGGNLHSFLQLEKLVKIKYNILTITLPTTSPTTLSWTLFDYSELIELLLKNLGVTSVNIVCHSFGFRVALLLNKKIKINKLVVCGGAGIFKNNLLRKLTIQNNKIALKNNYNKNTFSSLASNDYKTLSLTGKITFKNIVNLNLISCLKFSCPLLLFWGKYDTSTKLWIARKINQINNSKLFIVKSDHFAYLKENVELAKNLKEKYNVPVLPIDISGIGAVEITNIIKMILMFKLQNLIRVLLMLKQKLKNTKYILEKQIKNIIINL